MKDAKETSTLADETKNRNLAGEIDPKTPQYEQMCWDLARSQLGEERDRLCLWKSSFTDKDLDELFNNESDLYHALGASVIKGLLGIAESLHACVGM